MEDNSLVPAVPILEFSPKNSLYTLSDLQKIKGRLLSFRVEQVRLILKPKLSNARKKNFEKIKDLTNTLELYTIYEEPEKPTVIHFFGYGYIIYQDLLKLKQALFFVG